MPGVTVLTETRSGRSSAQLAVGAPYFVVGVAERGPVDTPTAIRSMVEYADVFGDRTAYTTLYDDLEMFFEEGGGKAFVTRIDGTTPVKANKTLMDRAGTPLSTLKVEALNSGDWGNSITVQVADGVPANSFTITIRRDAKGLVETYADLLNPAAALTAINGVSDLVTITNLSSATVAPNNNPAVLAATALTAGVDDRATIVAADYVTALALFTDSLGPGSVAVPGQTGTVVGDALLVHARVNRRTFLLVPAASRTPAQAKTDADAYEGDVGAEFGGFFYPYVKVPDGAGGTRTIAPLGYVAAKRAMAHEQVGPWRAGAGEFAQARFVVGLERELTRAEGDDLDLNRVNAIRTIAGTVRVYGWRSLSTDDANYKLITGRDTMNTVAWLANLLMESFVFGVVDSKGHQFARVNGELTGIVEPMRALGGLYEQRDAEGNLLDNGYLVDTGPGVNTTVTIAAGEIRANVAIRVAPTGTLVVITIVKAAQTAAL